MPIEFGPLATETDCTPLFAGKTVNAKTRFDMSNGPPKAELKRLPTTRLRFPPGTSGWNPTFTPVSYRIIPMTTASCASGAGCARPIRLGRSERSAAPAAGGHDPASSIASAARAVFRTMTSLWHRAPNRSTTRPRVKRIFANRGGRRAQ